MRMVIGMAIGLAVVLGSTEMATAEEGVPDGDRLARLGLAGLKMQSDESGKDVRGKAFGAFSLTFTLFVDDGLGTTDSLGPVTISHTYGTGAVTPPNPFGDLPASPEPQPLGATAFGGMGFGTFTNPANPNFNNFTSNPRTISVGAGPTLSTSSIQGFMFSIGR